MSKLLRGLVSFICALSLSLSGVVSVAAQTQQRFALAGTTWEISYQDARLGEVQGLAKFGDGQTVSGFYQDPRDGSEHPFTGVARLEMMEGMPVATISIVQEGPWIGPSPGDLSVKPGGYVNAKLGTSKASLTILETSPVTLSLELDEKTSVFDGLWTSENLLTKPMRAGGLNRSEDGNRYAAGQERWVPSTARFKGTAEIRSSNRNLFDDKNTNEQTISIDLRGIGLPRYEDVKKRTVDFKELADTLTLDVVSPNDGKFGRSLDIRVKAKEVPGPGTYPLTVNGVDGTWTLEYRDLLPRVRLIRKLRVDEFEPVSQVYIGEDIFAEVEFEEKDRVEALDFQTYDTTIIDSADALHQITVRKTGRGLYRSGPLACLAAEDRTNREIAGQLVCEDKSELTAIVEGARGYQQSINKPVVRAPSPLWDRAMAMAKACRTGGFDQTVKGVNVQPQVHAALILLRDEMKRSIAGTVETYNTLIGPDDDQRMKKLASDLTLYKASIKSGENDGALIQQVSLPNASKSDAKISLRDALNGNYEPKLSDKARADYEKIAASEAQGMMLSAAERTKKRLDGVGACDLAGLLQFGKLGAGAFNEKLKKKLLRKGLPGEADWMPDLAARAAVDSVADVVAAVKDEADYRQAQVDFALTMVSLATAVLAISATISTKLAAAGTRVAGRSVGKEYSKATLARLAAAAELSELAELGSAFTKVVDAQTRGQEAVDRARDLAPVIGADAFDQAQAEKDAQIKGAAIAAAASAAGAVGAGVLGRAGKAAPNKRVPLAEAAGLPTKPSSTSAAANALPNTQSTRRAGDGGTPLEPRPSDPAPETLPTRTASADEPPTGLAQNVENAPSNTAPRPRDRDATVKVEPDKTVSIPRNMRGEGVSTGAPRTADAAPTPARPRDPDATVKVDPNKTLAIPRNMRGEGISTGTPRAADTAQPRAAQPKLPKADPTDIASAPRAAELNSARPETAAPLAKSSPAKAGAEITDGGTEIVRRGQPRGRPDAATKTVRAGSDNYTLGERLGQGTSADVYRNASDASDNTALRVIHDQRPSAIPSERAGRKNLEALSAQNNGELFDVVKQVEPPRLIDSSDAPMLLQGRQVEVVERINNIASDVLKKNDPPYTGRMTPGQAAAHRAATDYMNDNGIAWIDNSPDNYGLVKLPGVDKWKMRVVDTGGVVKFDGPNGPTRARFAK
ncbi:MAG: hypothetical protein AAF221_04525 [Pseudomonadota bacterium]